MSGIKALISQLAISMGQSIGLSIEQHDNSICSQQGMVQFSTEKSGVNAIMPTSKMEIVDMTNLLIGRIYFKVQQKFQVFYWKEISCLFYQFDQFPESIPSRTFLDIEQYHFNRG